MLRNVRLLMVGLLFATPSSAQRDTFELEDTVAVISIDHELVAHSSRGSSSRLRLEIDERLIWHGASGRIGFAVSDRRIFGFHANTGWSDRRLRVAEASPARPELGDRLALFVTSQRAIAFDGHWREEPIGPQEGLYASSVGAGAALVVTNRRALALTPDSGDFVSIKLGVHERIERARAVASSAEVTTDERVLFFSGRTWSEQRRRLR